MKMKRELHASDNSPTAPPSRAKTPRMRPDSATAAASSGAKFRPKPAAAPEARRALQFSKPRAPASSTVEDDAKAGRRRRPRSTAEVNGRGSGVGDNRRDATAAEELQMRIDENERLLRESRSEVALLRAQVEKLMVANEELKVEKKKLEEDLCAAEENIKTLEEHQQRGSIIKSGFSDELEIVQKKLQKTRESGIRGVTISQLQSLILKPDKMLLSSPSPPFPSSKTPFSGPPTPPPPPPPPPPQPEHAQGRANPVHKASALVQLYHSLTKRDGKQCSTGNGGCGSPLSSNPHISIVGELQNRSAHLLAIKSDVETKGNFIKHLIDKVRTASFTNMDDALSFVDWLDGELSTLADERAVLKHFDWPEKKADALREAAFEYRDLKKLEDEASSFKDDACMPCEATLKKISSLLDKLERSVERLIKLKGSSMVVYKECKIPTEWMLESGMVSKMKKFSVKLAKIYMRRVSMELDSARHSERESVHEALLFEGVRFAYRAHQFSGGLDSETMFIFEELKTRVEAEGRAH